MLRDKDMWAAKDSMHILLEHEVVETGTDLFKPINSNPTSSAIVNPFAVARATYIEQLRKSEENTEHQR